MKIVENNILPFKGYKALSLLNYILIRKGVKLTPEDIQHEEIHWEQQKELLIIGFYLLYGLQFCWEFIRNKARWKKAYRGVAFEREAYTNENVEDYIKKRKHFAWARKQ